MDTRTLARVLVLQRSLQQPLDSPVFSLGLGITPGFPGSETLKLRMDHRATHKDLYLAEAHHHNDEPPKSREPVLPINPLSLLLIHLSEEPRLSDLGLWLLRVPHTVTFQGKGCRREGVKTRERKTSHTVLLPLWLGLSLLCPGYTHLHPFTRSSRRLNPRGRMQLVGWLSWSIAPFPSSHTCLCRLRLCLASREEPQTLFLVTGVLVLPSPRKEGWGQITG